jgi:undecaprenyl-diphosphatase
VHSLQQFDQSLFLYLNGIHADWLDPVMWQISQPITWIPVYISLVVFVILKHRPIQWFWILLSFGLMIFLCDYVVTNAIKNVVQRLRPSHDPALQNLVHLLHDSSGQMYKGGKFGFFSSHASNHAGIAVLFMLWMRPLKKHISLLLCFWVCIVSYSRIYLGVHYPSDIIVGMAYGAGASYLVYILFQRLLKLPSA